MPGMHRSAATAAALTLASLAPSQASDGNTPIAFYSAEQNQQKPEFKTASLVPNSSSGPDANAGGVVQTGAAGSIQKQNPLVSIGCLSPELLRILRGASIHFGSAAVVTSGFRPGRRSYHGKCMAADVQIAGIGSGALSRYFRAQSGVGGVGTYGHTRSVHVDVAPRQFTWRHGRRKRYAGIDGGMHAANMALRVAGPTASCRQEGRALTVVRPSAARA